MALRGRSSSLAQLIQSASGSSIGLVPRVLQSTLGQSRTIDVPRRESGLAGDLLKNKAIELAKETDLSKPLEIANFSDGVQRDAKDDISTPGRIRTCDLRINSRRR